MTSVRTSATDSYRTSEIRLLEKVLTRRAPNILHTLKSLDYSKLKQNIKYNEYTISINNFKNQIV